LPLEAVPMSNTTDDRAPDGASTQPEMPATAAANTAASADAPEFRILAALIAGRLDHPKATLIRQSLVWGANAVRDAIIVNRNITTKEEMHNELAFMIAAAETLANGLERYDVMPTLARSLQSRRTVQDIAAALRAKVEQLQHGGGHDKLFPDPTAASPEALCANWICTAWETAHREVPKYTRGMVIEACERLWVLASGTRHRGGAAPTGWQAVLGEAKRRRAGGGPHLPGAGCF
jgi:hypothetical protein